MSSNSAVGSKLDWYDPTPAQVPTTAAQTVQTSRRSPPPPPPPPLSADSKHSAAHSAGSAPAEILKQLQPSPPIAWPNQATLVKHGGVQDIVEAEAISAWNVDLDSLVDECAGRTDQGTSKGHAPRDAMPAQSPESMSSKELDNTCASAPDGRRSLSALEAARTVEEALRAKEHLATKSVASAMMSVAQRRKQLEEQQRLEMLRLQEEEAELQRLQSEVADDTGRIPEVEALRLNIERVGREMQYASGELHRKREAMRRATDAYVEAEEQVAGLREQKQALEQKMLNMLLEVGKRRDAKLNEILTRI